MTNLNPLQARRIKKSKRCFRIILRYKQSAFEMQPREKKTKDMKIRISVLKLKITPNSVIFQRF